MTRRFHKTPLAALAAAGLLLFTGCDATDGMDEAGEARVAVQFATAPAGAAKTGGASALVVEGTNGTLTLTDVRFIVAELELERLESVCDDGVAGEGCDDYEAPISFVQLPLDGGVVTVATDEVPAGAYDELEFEVENVEPDDDDDAAERAAIEALLADIRQELPSWPAEASLVVQGTFQPADGGAARPFTAYFEAEVEVELDLVPALRIDDAGASRALTVDVRPGAWFARADGSVVDLSRFDFAATGEVAELEVEIENGFADVEVDD